MRIEYENLMDKLSEKYDKDIRQTPIVAVCEMVTEKEWEEFTSVLKYPNRTNVINMDKYR